MEDFPKAEQIPFGQRARRMGLSVLQELVGYNAPDSIRNQRLAAHSLIQDVQQELPPTTESGE